MRIEFLTWFFSITTLTIFCSITIPAHSQCLEHQKSLLLQLKNSLKFDPTSSVKLVTWTQSHDCCQWNGVTCDHSGRVIGLDLSTESISGGLNHSSSLFRLKFLEKLNLAYNYFYNTRIPSSFGILTSLTYLNLSETGFVGQIPMEFSRLTRLVKLDLSTYYPAIQRTQIQNPNLFTLFRNLSGLTELYLDGVNISANGYEWGQAISSAMPNLRVLSLSDCLLSGPIDSSLQNLQFLSEINLNSNNLSVPVPDFLANFANLTALSLSYCNLNGTFPDIIFERVQTLETLALGSNPLLNGRLLESVGNLMELRRIDIGGCNFSGPIPNALANLSQLVYLDFSSNNFSDPIPSFQTSKNLTFIDLSHNSLTGVVLSTHFEGLLNLAYIDLAHNSFNGSIPSSMFSLPSLKKILLSNNKFGRQITWLSNKSLSPLNTLDLSSNKLEGPIPFCFFNFLRLNILSVSFNNFNGTIRLESIQRLQNLTRLDLSYNNLTVDIHVNNSILSSFPQLNVLSLASCNLKKFPALMNQSRIIHLDLSDNQISGVIPSWVWNVVNTSLAYLNLSCNLLVGLQSEYIMPSLGFLDLHSNLLSGDIPLPPETAIYVDYSGNKFNSSIPGEIGNGIASANLLSLSNNMLSGHIPPSICNGSNLKVLDLSNNRLSGTIPQCLIDNCTETLGILNLGNNSLSGHILGTFPQGCALKTLDLNRNYLEGPAPESLSNCANLEVLNLGNNKMNDNFTCFLKNLSNLRVLVLRSNDFQGDIRCPGVNNSTWRKLQIIDISSNNFSGDLPPEYFLLWNAMMIDGSNANPHLDHLRYEFLMNEFYYQDHVIVRLKGLDVELVKIITLFTAVDFSGNSFEGEIPHTIGALSSLHMLNMSRNALSGQIPSKLGNLTQLESLDLSVNKLNGRIPETLTDLTFLSVLNLSYNQLVGGIPEGRQFQTFSNDSFVGNAGLCGLPLSNACKETEPPTPTFDGRHSYSDEEEINWVYITATLGYTVGFGVIVGPLLYCKRWRQCYYKHVDRVILRILHHQEQRARLQRRRDNRNVIRRRQDH